MTQPNKELGQHWLYDEASLQAVADAADVKEGDTVVEVGPGKGTLTGVLLDRGAHVIAVEFDRELAKALPKEFATSSNLTVFNEDILQFNFSSLPDNYKIAGNIPYYLTSKLIRNILELKNSPKRIGLLIQKEVAERVAAPAGEMSVLSVAAQLYSDVELGLIVPAELFTPPPKVDSQVLSLAPKELPEELDTRKFFRIVKAGFGERRKKLVNSLSGGLQISKNEAESLLKAAGISANVRAQELNIENWLELQKVA